SVLRGRRNLRSQAAAIDLRWVARRSWPARAARRRHGGTGSAGRRETAVSVHRPAAAGITARGGRRHATAHPDLDPPACGGRPSMAGMMTTTEGLDAYC